MRESTVLSGMPGAAPPASRRYIPLIKEVCFAAVFLLAAIMVYDKCRYGFASVDECFYLLTPIRLHQGDALFGQEWHLSQTSSVLLLPIVRAFFLLTGSTDGIILTMRFICTTVQLLTSLFLYFRFRKICWSGAALASISFLLYTPFGIMALSYNSMGILFLSLALILFSTSVRHFRAQSILSGIFLSAAVLCCPYLAVLYVLYGFAVLYINHKNPPKADSLWSVSRFAFFSVGVAVSALAFVAFVLSRASYQEILQALPYIFSDSEHPRISLADKVAEYFRSILEISPLSKPITFFLLLLFIICSIDRNRAGHPLIYAIPALLSVSLLLRDYAVAIPYINLFMWPVNLLPPLILLLSGSRQIHRLFFSFYLPGILYSFCLNLSSNQQFYAISSASSVATIASIVILCLFASEWPSLRVPKLLRFLSTVCLCAVFLLQFKYQSELRYQSLFWAGRLSEQTGYIDEGAYKGLYVSEDREKTYADSMKQMESLAQYAQPDDHVLILSQNTWYYLMIDYRIGAYSGWLSGINASTIDRLEAYYSLNPDKIPDVVWVDPGYHVAAQTFADRFHYAVQPVENGIILTRLPQ